jgi:hypothetical protein
MRRAARWGIGCGVPLALWASLYFPSHRPPAPDNRVELPPGERVAQRPVLCGRYVERDDLKYLFGDPTNLVETRTEYSDSSGRCWFFDGKEDRFILKIEIASNDDPAFASQIRYSRTVPGALVEKNGVGSIYRDGRNAAAIVRGSRYYVAIFLRQGPISFDKVRKILQMANKFSAALPESPNQSRGTAPKKSSQK